MNLTPTQLTTIAARAFPDDTLRDIRQLGAGRYALELASRERVQLLTYDRPAAARNAAAALRMVAGEIDLPLPVLRAADETGATVGVPYTLVSGIDGEPLAQVRAQVADSQLNQIGQRLGEVIQRVHRLAVPQFGLLGEASGAASERAYVLARLDADLGACAAIGFVNNTLNDTLRGWFVQAFLPIAKHAALVHGALSDAAILTRPSDSGWVLSGIVGWEHAVGWSPTWEHTVFLENTDRMRDFGLRVGYGLAYDERTQRTYEQVRESAMMPYRVLALLEGMRATYAYGDLPAAERKRASLLSLTQILIGKPT